MEVESDGPRYRGFPGRYRNGCADSDYQCGRRGLPRCSVAALIRWQPGTLNPLVSLIRVMREPNAAIAGPKPG